MQVGIVRRMYRTFAARTAGRLDSKQSVRTLTSASHMSVFTLKNRRMIQRLSVYGLNQKIFTFKELESENIELKNYSDSLIDYQNSWWIIQRHNMLFLSLWSQPEHKMFVGCRQWRTGLNWDTRFRSRSSGGINTRSHIRFCSDPETFTDRITAQRLLFNFWDSKVDLSPSCLSKPRIRTDSDVIRGVYSSRSSGSSPDSLLFSWFQFLKRE